MPVNSIARFLKIRLRDTEYIVFLEDIIKQHLSHLFPGDRDEHGAVIAAGYSRTSDGRIRLLARTLHLAKDGVDYVPGKRGYRMLRANSWRPA